MSEQLLLHQQSEGLTLPPIQEDLLRDETPAGNSRSFCFEGKSRVSKQFLVTPVDESTGVPFPIYPSKDLPPPIHSGQKNTDRLADWHHPFHPRAELVQGDLGRRALRGCRMQWAKYEDHHDGVGYHQTFAGPAIPDNDHQLFKTIVFASAGYIGNHALKFAEDGEASVVELSGAASRRLMKPGVFCIDDYNRVAKYLLEYSTKNSITKISPEIIDELLNNPDLDVKQRIATDLIGYLSEEVTSAFKDEFRQAKLARWLPRNRTSSAANYVRNLLTVQREGGRMVDKRNLRALTEAVRAS